MANMAATIRLRDGTTATVTDGACRSADAQPAVVLRNLSDVFEREYSPSKGDYDIAQT